MAAATSFQALSEDPYAVVTVAAKALFLNTRIANQISSGQS